MLTAFLHLRMPGNACFLSQAIEADISLWDTLSQWDALSHDHPIWIILTLLILISPFIIREWRKASNENLKIVLKDERQRMKLNNALKRHQGQRKGKETTAMWLTLALVLALVGVLLRLFYWQRKDLERLRAYDVAAERFHRAAMRLLKHEDLPQDIVAVIAVINECTALSEKAHMAIEKLPMAQKDSEKARHRRQEARKSLAAFVERHPETRRLLQDMIMNGLTALLLRLGPVERWKLRSLMRGAERRMLREDKVATALADSDLVQACHA